MTRKQQAFRSSPTPKSFASASDSNTRSSRLIRAIFLGLHDHGRRFTTASGAEGARSDVSAPKHDPTCSPAETSWQLLAVRGSFSSTLHAAEPQPKRYILGHNLPRNTSVWYQKGIKSPRACLNDFLLVFGAQSLCVDVF